MKIFRILLPVCFFFLGSCVMVSTHHDNGKHKGWFKNPNNPHNPAHSTATNSNAGNNGNAKGKAKGKSK